MTDSGAGLRVLRRETFGLNHLLGAAARMTEASELSEVLAVAVEQAADFLGPVGGLLGLLDASRRTIVFAGLQGVPASMMRGSRSVPADADLPMAEALRSGRAVWLSGAAERARRYPRLAARTPEPYACGSVPLPGAGRPLGVLCLTRMREGARQRPFGEAERIFTYTLADLVGAAIAGLQGADRGQAAGAGGLAGRASRWAGRAGDRAGIGVYQWDLVSGRLCGNADMLRLHGRDPAAGAGLGSQAGAGLGVQAGVDEIPGFAAACRELGLTRHDYAVRYQAAGRTLEARGHSVTTGQAGGRRVLGIVTQVTPARRTCGRRACARPPVGAAVPGELSTALAAAVTVADVSQAAAVALRAFGAAGTVIADQDGGHVRILARAGFAPARPGPLASWPRAPRTAAADALVPRVPTYLGSNAELLARMPHFGHLLPGLDEHAWAVLPLASEYDAAAAWLLAFPPGWSPAGEEQAGLLMSAGLLGQVLDRCRTHDHEHRLVTEMRRGLTGGPAADLPGLTLACRYQPGTFGLGVGGDFYDAFLQPGGTPALLIGDVQGHGPRAASMADRLRTAVRAYALEGHDPAGIIGRANRFVTDLNGAADEPLYATCCYVSVDSAGGRLRTARAGHPHPIVTADRHPARLLAADGGLPLGIDQGHRYRQSTFAVRPGSTLLLYTDGLTERPGLRAAEDDGILAELDGIGSADPATIVARLRAFSDPRSGYDDIAVLAARLTGSWGA